LIRSRTPPPRAVCSAKSGAPPASERHTSHPVHRTWYKKVMCAARAVL